jgi:hypothetical protein
VILALAAHIDRNAIIGDHCESGWFLIQRCDLAARQRQLSGRLLTEAFELSITAQPGSGTVPP